MCQTSLPRLPTTMLLTWNRDFDLVGVTNRQVASTHFAKAHAVPAAVGLFACLVLRTKSQHTVICCCFASPMFLTIC